MSVVVLILLTALVMAVAGMLVVMFVKEKPLYGAMGLCVLLGPGTVLAFLYVVLAQG
jgi:hypothetical protein